MITCPRCQSAKWKQLHRSPIRPEEDRFQCLACGQRFARYDAPLDPPPLPAPLDYYNTPEDFPDTCAMHGSETDVSGGL